MERLINNLTKFKNQLNPFLSKLLNEGELTRTKFTSLAIFGMGGSGVVGDFIKAFSPFLKINIPVEIIKDNKLENCTFYNSQTLFLGISFSGNTKETISLAQKIITSHQLKNQLVLLTTGGKIEQIATQKKIPLIKIPSLSLTPREGIGLMCNGVFLILKKVFGAQIPRINLKGVKYFLKTGEKIASQIKGGIIIYTPYSLKHLGIFWKNNFNETSKQFCTFNTYPEINHNEVESFKNLKGAFSFVFLDTDNYKKDKKKINIIKNILTKNKHSFLSIKIPGKNTWEKTWNGVLLSYSTSYHLAIKNKENPLQTEMIAQLKETK